MMIRNNQIMVEIFMNYIKAFFSTTLGWFVAAYIFGYVIIFILGSINEGGFNIYLYSIFLESNFFIRYLVALFVGAISAVLVYLIYLALKYIIKIFLEEYKSSLSKYNNKIKK